MKGTMFIVCLIALIAAIMVITPAAATTETFSADRDVCLCEMNPNSCFGSAPWIAVVSEIDGNWRDIVHFDLSSIPSGATIESATLHLYRYGYEEYYEEGEDRVYDIHRMTTDWTEGTPCEYPCYPDDGATWLTTDGTTNWGTYGGDYVSTPTDGILIQYGTVGIWNVWDATSDVQAFVDGTQNYGWLINDAVESIEPDDLGPMSSYHSREYGDDESLRPYLEVTYTGGGEEKPDLNVTAITTPANIFATESNVINATIKNNGTGDAGAFNVSLSADGTEIEEVNVTAGLSAGNSKEVTFEWTPAASGTYELCVVADCEGAVDESDEANNVTCEDVEVVVPPPIVTSLAITPNTGITGQVQAYNIIVNTTGFTSLTVTIPAGFRAKTPSGGEEIARADLWWNNELEPYYGYVTFTANTSEPSEKMDVYADIGGTVTYPGMAVNYTEGATTSIKSPFGSHPERANLTLPTASEEGCLKISGLPNTITNVTVSIGAFVQNPDSADTYTFTAKAEGEAVGESAAVTVEAPAPPGIVSYAPFSAAISDTEGATRTFNITVNQTVNVSWQINGTEVQYNNTGGVTEASYTNTSAAIGTWNVSAVVSNPNGTVMQTWIWTVEAPSPCFIATAAYGTPLHEDIDILRDFRDERLMTNPLGRTLVKTYYETSPPIADALREHEGLRTAVREGLIKPLVYVSRTFVGEDSKH